VLPGIMPCGARTFLPTRHPAAINDYRLPKHDKKAYLVIFWHSQQPDAGQAAAGSSQDEFTLLFTKFQAYYYDFLTNIIEHN